MGIQRFRALHVPLLALLGQCGPGRIEFRAKRLEFGLLRGGLLGDCRLLGLQRGLLLFQRAAPGIQLRLSRRKLLGFRCMGIQRFRALHVPLLALLGQCGPRRIDFRAKRLEFGLLRGGLLGDCRLLCFQRCLLLFQRAALGIQLRLSGRKLLGLRGIRSQRIPALRLPLSTFVGQRGAG